jgi:hypothetical protein
MMKFLQWCRYGTFPNVTFPALVLGGELAICIAFFIFWPQAFNWKIAAALAYIFVGSVCYAHFQARVTPDPFSHRDTPARWTHVVSAVLGLAWPAVVIDKMIRRMFGTRHN